MAGPHHGHEPEFHPLIATMTGALNNDVETWEDEGGAAFGHAGACAPLDGSPAQVEWALRIRCRVNDEFDRVAAAFRSVAARQIESKRTDTEAIIAIVEEKRAEVMGRQQAGYFIHDWQEIGDQVRQMIFEDPRYQAIKSR
jgi:hypothetical protein